ncbi:MAG: PQQ-dependent sugar dehydrogenase [Myxococcota bacterium]
MTRSFAHALRVALILPLVMSCGSCAPRATVSRPAPPPTRTLRALPGVLSTRTLTGEVHRVRIEDLPEPYASESARQGPELTNPPEGTQLAVPEGFAVQLFARDVSKARWLAEAPDGTILVAQSREEKITWLLDDNGDGVAEAQGVFAEGDPLDIPFGMAFATVNDETFFFLGNQDEVRRWPWRAGQRSLEGTGTRITELPGGGYRQHWTRNVVTNGERLFVSVGSRSNVGREDAPRATVQVMNFDGSERRTWASGLRNPVGLAFHPTTGALYANVNERDHLGDDLVPDFFTRVDEGAFYGWPYAYLRASLLDPRRMRNGRSEAPELAARTRSPDVLYQAHSAALGLAFYDHDAFGARYRGGAFAAFRGSWNRSSGTGYKLVFLPFEDGRALGHYEDFLTGFMIDPSVPTTWGRPVGVLARSDGSLLFTEEAGGRVFRVVRP